MPKKLGYVHFCVDCKQPVQIADYKIQYQIVRCKPCQQIRNQNYKPIHDVYDYAQDMLGSEFPVTCGLCDCIYPAGQLHDCKKVELYRSIRESIENKNYK